MNSGRKKRRWTLIVALAASLLSAAAPESPDDFILRGNGAIERGDFNEALQLYQRAEERGTDPGLIAFNRATAYFHLADYRQAEIHYRLALDDAAIPPERRVKAFFNLGDCLFHEAGETEIKKLRDAIRCFESCLDLAPEEGLRLDASHNLELAKLLWIKARARTANPPDPNTDDPPEPKTPEPKKDGKEPKSSSDPGKEKKGTEFGKTDTDPNAKIDEKAKADPKAETKKSAVPPPRDAGPPVLPDTDRLERLSPEDTLQTLKQVETRLHQERQRLRMDAANTEKPNGKDW